MVIPRVVVVILPLQRSSFTIARAVAGLRAMAVLHVYKYYYMYIQILLYVYTVLQVRVYYCILYYIIVYIIPKCTHTHTHTHTHTRWQGPWLGCARWLKNNIHIHVLLYFAVYMYIIVLYLMAIC